MDLRRIILLLLLLGAGSVYAQSTCGNQHRAPGAFVCSPNPAFDSRGASVPEMFHVSAQGNALTGRKIDFYRISLDRKPIFQSRLAIPAERLSIEVNLRSTVVSGIHTLTVAINGAGTAEVERIQFHALAIPRFCEPVSTVPSTGCTPSKYGDGISWSKTALHTSGTTTNPGFTYASFSSLYLQNLETLEADTADAVAIDANENLYAAWHLLTGLELRKYSHDGSIVYDAVISTCGPGLLAISGIAVDRSGRAWIAGNTTACLVTNPNNRQHRPSDPNQQRGFVMLLDTSSPSRTAPLYTTYLADTESEITGIQVDEERNAYLTGTTESSLFPHEFTYALAQSNTTTAPKKTSFVAVVNASGSRLQWSALVEGAELTALSLDRSGNIYTTGSTVGLDAGSGPPEAGSIKYKAQRKSGLPYRDVILAKLSHTGKDMSYIARLGFATDGQGLAISVTPDGQRTMVIADINSQASPPNLHGEIGVRATKRNTLLVVQPCTRRAAVYSIASPTRTEGAEFVIGPALKALTSAVSDSPRLGYGGGEALYPSFRITPACIDQGR